MTKVLIRALSPISRTGLERMIAAETDLLIVKEESDGGDEEPDVIVSEVGPAEDSAREATMEIAEGGPAVLLLADDSSPFWTGEAIIAGARGILPRSITQEELAAAVRAAAAGLIVIHPDDAASYFPARAGGGPPPATPEPLTPREREVLRLVADGFSNKEIAARLGISDHTVKFHVASIMGKLAAGSRTEAVMIAVRTGLVMV